MKKIAVIVVLSLLLVFVIGSLAYGEETERKPFDFEAKIQELTKDSETRSWNIGERRKKIDKLRQEILRLQGDILVNSGSIKAFKEVRAQEKVVEEVKEEGEKNE